MAVPGLGLCLPERLAEGWLVRPRTGERAVDAELDLTGTPVLRVGGERDGWRTTLTRRHAQVLLLLHRAGPAGLSAAQLSTALFGDGDHLVTARAEVSRLRRAVGGLVLTNPYRLGPDVTLRVVSPALG
jgi:hypothetical protein